MMFGQTVKFEMATVSRDSPVVRDVSRSLFLPRL
jgi:hypothetical protein